MTKVVGGEGCVVVEAPAGIVVVGGTATHACPSQSTDVTGGAVVGGPGVVTVGGGVVVGVAGVLTVGGVVVGWLSAPAMPAWASAAAVTRAAVPAPATRPRRARSRRGSVPLCMPEVIGGGPDLFRGARWFGLTPPDRRVKSAGTSTSAKGDPMRAAVLRNTGDELLEIHDDVELVDAGPGQVKVKIEATGVCHSDVSGMTGIIPQPAPFVPGHEGAGTITEVGPGVTNVKEGDHVIVAWSPPCGQCNFCVKHHQPHLCVNIQFAMGAVPNFRLEGNPVFGFAGTGTFAEEIILPHQAVVPISKDVPFEIASLVGCGVMTGVGAALNTAEVKPGSSVVVFGCGGVGIAAIQGARVAGAAEIVAVDLVDQKLEDAKRFGATHAVKPDDLDAAKNEITGGDGFDYAFEAIGLPTTMRSAYDVTRRGGTTCIIGVGALDKFVQFSAFEIFFSEKNFTGSYYGSADVRSDFDRVLGLWKAGRLDLEGMISRRIGLEDVNDAVAALKAGETIRQVISF